MSGKKKQKATRRKYKSLFLSPHSTRICAARILPLLIVDHPECLQNAVLLCDVTSVLAFGLFPKSKPGSRMLK